MKGKSATKKTRRKKGFGRLYKRGKDGKEYPAESKIQGVFYLEYRADGKRVRQRLIEEGDKPITTIRKAQEQQLRVTAPFREKNKVEQLRALQAKLEVTEDQYRAAHEAVNPPLSIEDTWEAYEASDKRPDSGEKTLASYAGHWRRFHRWLTDNEPTCVYLRDVTETMASAYMKTLKDNSPNTYNKHLAFLRLAYDVLKKPGRIVSDPFEEIKPRKLKPNSRRALTIEEIQLILTEATGDLEVLLALGTFTGLRLGDCCTLKWGEVDLVAGVIRRVPNKIRSRKNKPVVIGIPPMLAALLKATPKKNRRGYVLPDMAKRYDKDPCSITKVVQAHLEACGIRTHKQGTGLGTGKRAVVEVGFHSLRHSYVSLHAERGTPQAVVQAVVGHGSPQMTQSYTHISPEVAKQLSGVIDLDSGKNTHKEPLPSWAVEKLKKMTARNWKKVKQELLEAPCL
ncbi:tyrosine-type recombinase/integrase [Planctomycetota bacterium]